MQGQHDNQGWPTLQISLRERERRVEGEREGSRGGGRGVEGKKEGGKRKERGR